MEFCIGGIVSANGEKRKKKASLRHPVLPHRISNDPAFDFEAGEEGEDLGNRFAKFAGNDVRIDRTEPENDGEDGVGRRDSGDGGQSPAPWAFGSGNEAGDFGEDVVGGKHALGDAVADERVGADGGRPVNVARDGENFAVELDREPGGDEAAGFAGGFGDDGPLGIGRDERVADGKVERERLRSERKARNHAASGGCRDSVEERTVFARVFEVDAGPDDRKGRSARFERLEVRDRVDAVGSARNHGPTVPDERPDEVLRDGGSVGSALARTYDRNRNRSFGKTSPKVEEVWRTGEFGNPRRIVLISKSDEADAPFSEGFANLFGIVFHERSRELIDPVGSDSCP